ncbi:hypothetical protein ACH5RR_018275, partial [Cinchona calisaya]
GELFSFNLQLQNHRRIVSRLQLLIRSKAATKRYLARCLYTVGFGNNDYINNYLEPQFYGTSRIYTPRQFAGILIRHYSRQLRRLYLLGARKVAVYGLGSLGCIPAELFTNGTCVDSINNEVQLFNDNLMPLVDLLNVKLRDAQFIYVNVTAINSSNSSTPAEITIGNAPCCNVSVSVADGQCMPGQVPCSNRNQYYFWDDFHPTEIVNQAFSRSAYVALSPLLDAYPFAIDSPAELNSRAENPCLQYNLQWLVPTFQ